MPGLPAADSAERRCRKGACVKTSDLRQLYLDFFVERGHLLMPSASLVPYRDPSVLLTTAGMQPFKPYFLGLADPPARRLTSSQKCFRTTDIDRVGLTARHCTFFEMLGNFSVGDYFKKEAIGFAYQLSTERLELEPERLWITVFQGDAQVPPDEEAMEYWEAAGIPRERMVALPRSDNFWGPPGPSGPCGPCSELYYDRGPAYGCGDPDCRPGCDCDRFFEYWNLVFMQYNMDEEKRLTPLPSKNIDTGMGLERIATLKQEVTSVFLTDVFRPLIELGEEVAGVRFGDDERVDVALRVLADHSRAVSMLIADGVLPSNEGRGYVLRRIIRRASRFSRSAGMEPPFLGRFAQRTIELLGSAYPELDERRETILRVVNAEEDRFNRTLDQGLVLLEQEVTRAAEAGGGVFPGSAAFLLHDTYGFPVEVTREIVEESGLTLDLSGFEQAMAEQRGRARGGQGDDQRPGGDHHLRPPEPESDRVRRLRAGRGVHGGGEGPASGRRAGCSCSYAKAPSTPRAEVRQRTGAGSKATRPGGGLGRAAARRGPGHHGAPHRREHRSRDPGEGRHLHRLPPLAGGQPHGNAPAPLRPPLRAGQGRHPGGLRGARRQVPLRLRLPRAAGPRAPGRGRGDRQPQDRREPCRCGRSSPVSSTPRTWARWPCSARSTATSCASSRSTISAGSSAAARTSARPARSAFQDPLRGQRGGQRPPHRGGDRPEGRGVLPRTRRPGGRGGRRPGHSAGPTAARAAEAAGSGRGAAERVEGPLLQGVRGRRGAVGRRGGRARGGAGRRCARPGPGHGSGGRAGRPGARPAGAGRGGLGRAGGRLVAPGRQRHQGRQRSTRATWSRRRRRSLAAAAAGVPRWAAAAGATRPSSRRR